MINKVEDYAEHVRRIYAGKKSSMDICRDITIQITSECNLRCSYCYEHNKKKEVMSFETVKQIIDSLINMYESDDEFLGKNTKAVIFSFIGGEPLLEPKIIEEFCDYWFEQCYIRKIPIATHTRVDFATNGLLWFSKDAQHLIKKYHDIMSLTVSIDGVKELHDKYRINYKGIGSFDMAFAAFKDAQKYGWYNSKMTFVPSSFKYIYDSIKMMIEEGCEQIYCNCAYEPVYTPEDGAVLYDQLCKVADYVIENRKDNFISILDDYVGSPSTSEDNYCGGTGKMLAFSPSGKIYPCIRYAPISIGDEKASKVCLGDCYNGLYTTEAQKKVKEELDSITLKSQSTQECINCKVSSGCGWCSGYNYECFGTANCRSTNICWAHKARALACYYYYNKRFICMGDCSPKHIYLSYDDMKKIIGEQKAKELIELEILALNHIKMVGDKI